MNMKKYRMNYDKCFIAMNSKGESLVINGDTIMDMSVLLEYRVYDKETGQEIFFTCPDSEEPKESFLDEGYSMNAYYRCDYDREKGFVITPTDVCKNSKYRVEYSVRPSYEIGVTKGERVCGVPLSEGVEIPQEQFYSILKDYPDYFDTTTNQNSQSGAYAVTIVK